MRIPALIVALVVAAVVALLLLRSDGTPPPSAGAPPGDPAGVVEGQGAATAVDPDPVGRGVIPTRLDLAAPAAAGSDSRTVSGRVVRADGSPLAAAEVTLHRLITPWPAEQLEELDRVLSGADGHFQFGVEAGGDLVVEAASRGWARTRVAAPPEVRDLEIRLAPGFTVRGVVVNPSQRPAVGATVALEPGPWSDRRALVTTADERGQFQFADVSAGATGTARITARLAPFQPATVLSHPIGSDEALRIQIPPQPGYPMIGRVTRAGNGKPVAGASVRVYPSIAWNHRLYAPHQTTTGEDGTFQLLGQSLGSALIVVEHPELSAASRVVTVGSSTSSQSFELSRRSAVEIVATGVDLTGVELLLTSSAFEADRARIDADGIARFAGRFSVGPASLEVAGGVRAFARSSGRLISVTIEDADLTRFDLELVETSRLRGRVVDFDGNPVPAVTVSTPRFRFQPRNPDRWFGQTDEAGRFEMLGLPVGSASLTFEHPDHAPIEIDAETPVPGSESIIEDVRLVGPGSVRGRVTRGGAPLAGAVLLAGRDRSAAVTAVSDADGRYELRLAPGRYRILARYAAMPIQVSDRVVQVEGGGAIEDIDLDFPQGRRIRGIIAGAQSIPVPDAFVFVVGVPGAMSATDQNGRFELDVPEGPLELQVFSPNFQIQVRESFGPKQDHVHIRLPWIPHGTLEGSVFGVGPRGARPLGEVILRVRPLDPSPEWDENERRQRELLSTAVPLSGGRLSFDRMPVGRSRVELSAPGFVPHVTEVEVVSDRSCDLGDVRLEPGLELRGVVHDVEGRPITGAFAHLGLEDDLRLDLARRSMTDAQGAFVLRGVAPDSKRLVVYADGFASTVVDVRIPQDLIRRDPLPIVLQRASSVVVQLMRDGAPSGELKLVSVRYQGQLHAIRGTDTEGRFTFVIDLPGRYTVGLFGEEAETTIEFEVGAEPERRVIELELK